MTAPSEPAKGRGRGVVIAAVLLVLFVLWPLSIGPLMWLEAHGHIDPAMAPWIYVAYRPWDWLYSNSTIVEEFFDWYCALWVPSMYR